MARPLEVPQKFWQEDFISLAKKEKNKKEYIRLLALYYVQERKTYCEISEMLNISIRSIQSWVKRYALEGVKGVKSRTGQGRKSTLTEADKQNFKALLLKMLEEKAGSRLNGKDAKTLLEKHFKHTCSLRTVYRLLHSIGLLLITEKDIQPASSPMAQKTSKKTSKI